MKQPPEWLNTLTGRNLLREEVRQVRRALDSIFGDQFVQIGAWGDAGLFRRLARTRRAAVITETALPGSDAVSAAAALAIAGLRRRVHGLPLEPHMSREWSARA